MHTLPRLTKAQGGLAQADTSAHTVWHSGWMILITVGTMAQDAKSAVTRALRASRYVSTDYQKFFAPRLRRDLGRWRLTNYQLL